MPAAAPLKIAYLTGEYPKASHTFILREIAALRAMGHAVESCSVRRVGADQLIGPEEIAEERRTFYVLEAAKRPRTLLAAHAAAFAAAPGRYLGTLGLALRSGRPGARGTLWQLFYFAEAAVLAAHLKARGVRHLHNHFADSSANVAMLTGALAGIPFSYTLHGPVELFDPEGWRLPLKTARAAFVACISNYARSQAMLFSDPAHWGRIAIVHCGVTPGLYAAPPPAAEPGRLALAFVGRLAAIKGLRVLLQALEPLRARHPGITLTLIGDGPDRAHLEAMAAPHGAAVRFLGYRSQAEVAATLAASDALVLPSFAEGVPVVLMEAMAAGRPVIATAVGGVGELVEDGVSGHVVPPGDPAALVRAIADLAENPERRLEMGRAGQEKVRAEFDVATEARKIAALIAGARHEEGQRPCAD